MKYKKIVGFGDSWMWGDELLNPELKDHPHAHPVFHENTPYRESHCFLGLLGQHYGVPTENFGIAGGSMQSTIWTYLWWIEHEQLDPSECLILVGLTEPNRHTFYNPDHVAYSNDPPWNKFVHTSWVLHGSTYETPEWQKLAKMHMALSSCSELELLTLWQTVMFFEGQYHALNQNVLQFSTMENTTTLKGNSVIWPEKGQGLRDFVDHDQSLTAKDGHPNEAGHWVIRDRLIKEIDHATMSV